MIEKYWRERRKTNQGEPKYISLCFILNGSGINLQEANDIFDSYMIEGEDYDTLEKETMVDYLFNIAQDERD